VTIELQNTGDSRVRGEILAGVEHVLSDLAGEWRMSIVGSRASDNWEMKVEGPHGFERLYTLIGLRQYGTCLLSCCPRARQPRCQKSASGRWPLMSRKPVYEDSTHLLSLAKSR
jgi:hypothetical protein